MFLPIVAPDTALLTRAERTKYAETSTYADVISFCEELVKRNPKNSALSFSGTSAEGRKIPLVTVAEPMVKNADEAAKSGKLLIYVQANIHAGEVEGKEAAMHLMRKWVRDRNLLKKAIFLVQPIYNCDGNEKFGPQAKNRPGQNGPESVGLRPNGMGLDLNRDCMKAESPEMQGALKNIYSWNPDVVFDLHTTDGTRHGYPVTYGGPGNPNTHPALLDYAFNKFFPEVRATAKERFKLELNDYGNAFKDKDGNWRFETFAGDGRFVTNYAGLRGALPILSEAIVYEPFDIRVRDTERFVSLCLDKIIKDAKTIKEIHQQSEADIVAWGADPDKAPKLATRFKLKTRGIEEILMDKSDAKVGPVRQIQSIKMEMFDRFEGAEFSQLPYAYIISEVDRKVVDLLLLHGIKVDKLDGFEEKINPSPLEAFKITKKTQASQPFQGHKLISLEGTWRSYNRVPSGYVVKTAQPLGLLAFELLEPSAQDGATAWGFIDDDFTVDTLHPITRLLKPVALRTKSLDP